jgi:glycosyltransferase involved in cell wall biosynthesis
MTDGPTVDVVMCTNRLSPFLGEALAGLRGQTYPLWRLYLVDDGSGFAADLEQAAQGLPGATVLHREAAGPATARNTGIRAGHGAIVTFLDDDDLWHPERLARAVDALAENPEASGAYGDGIDIDATGRAFGGWTSPPATAEQYLRGVGALPRITTLSLRRSALERTGLFRDGMYLAEDTELTLRVVRSGQLVHTGAVMVSYRRHGSNATTREDWRRLHRAGREAIALNAAAARRLGDLDQVRWLRENRRRYGRFAASQGVERAIAHARAGRPGAALRDASTALLLSPRGVWRGVKQRLVRRARSTR